jgi:hypothetical protein
VKIVWGGADVKKLLAISATIVGLTLLPLAHAQQQTKWVGKMTPKFGGTRVSEKDAARPAPKLPDGKPDLSGPWVGGGVNNDFEEEAGMKPGEIDRYLLPWAKALRDSRKPEDEPYTACLPMAPPPAVHPYPWRIIQSYTEKGMSHIFLIHENGDAGTRRQIFMDGRKHPAPNDIIPTWFGHSIGRWEGNTLVVDTIGYNGKNWYDQKGIPYTDKLHTIERYSRPSYGTLINDMTIEDPGTFTQPLNINFQATLNRTEVMEFVCLENNQYGVAGGFKPGTGIGNAPLEKK